MSDPTPRRLRRTTNAALLAVLAGSLVTSGCLFGKKKTVRVFTPPPVQAKIPPSNTPPVVTETLPEAPETTEPTRAPAPTPLATLPPAPPKPLPAKPPAPAKPSVAETPATPAPKPTTIFSAAERRRLTRELDDRLGRVRKALARVEGKSLSGDLIALANNARAFLAQAEQARAQDLVTAVNLAKRADLFASDLVSRLP